MFNLFLKKKATAPPQPSRKFCDGEFGFYGEGYFHELLGFEQERSVRSGRPFLLMTIDVTGIRSQQRRLATRIIMDALATLMRNTDIKGWYKSAAVLGVIFTEMNSLETEPLRRKLAENLSAMLAEEPLDALKINFQIFFNDGNPGDAVEPSQIAFSPHVAMTDVHDKSDVKAQNAA